MPLYDLGYKNWSGDWTTHPYRWWVVTRQGIGLLANRKRFLALMALSGIPFLVRAVLIYLSASAGSQVPLLQVDAKFFEAFLSQQGFFVFIISIYAGAGLISNDLKANALQIYFSKPITRQDYLLGKLGILVFFLALPTLVPGVLLYFLAILLEANLEFFRENYWVLGSIVSDSLLMIFTYGLLILGLSSVGKSSRFAGISYAAAFFFSQVLYTILSSVLRTSRVGWISLNNNIRRAGDFLFRTDSRFQYAPWISFIILAALMAGAVWTAYKRVKAVEVVV
jgi:ABC-type transport system involved in multi-copper enzyme maturation permease subunit